ncbi:hypothetical protein FCI23_30995 [Actinacidiphila oryziradicis]|uniref:Tyr recombinase domain-containing protein n=1 Tax=Actinacidiphila oryziradicis TaxID=2571141 RepID=A0A4U0SD10_9ACTN|nr:hypothetical protein FCI23_30995 [Actinacidiphila oryziradicis]
MRSSRWPLQRSSALRRRSLRTSQTGLPLRGRRPCCFQAARRPGAGRTARTCPVTLRVRPLPGDFDELTEIPPPGLLPRSAGRAPPPYLYSQAEITALIHAARHLAHPLRAATFESFIGLMAATGIRTGEAMGLDRADPDLDRGVLLVRGTKFGKSRLVPLHPTTVEQLAGYQRRRDELCPRPSRCRSAAWAGQAAARGSHPFRAAGVRGPLRRGRWSGRRAARGR